MSMRTLLQSGFVALAVAASAAIAPAGAAPVYDTSVGPTNLTGTRVLDVQQLETDGATELTSLTLSWNIGYTMGVALPWSYSYSISWTPTGANAISHFILDLSDDCTAASSCVANAKLNGNSISIGAGNYATYSSANPSNPGMGGAIKGIKFDVSSGTPYVITFDSDRAPVWGDFYTKAGNVTNAGWYSQNVGIDQHATSENILNFVARPDTTGTMTCPDGTSYPCSGQQVSTPEPLSMAMMGMGLLGLAGVRMQRRKGA
jgi:hypothetical protein